MTPTAVQTAALEQSAAPAHNAAPEETVGPDQTVDMPELPELDFVSPMPGFGDYRRFVLVRLDEDGYVFNLRSLEQEALSFLVVLAAGFFPDYEPELDEGQRMLIGLDKAEDAMVLLVISPGETAAEATANLLAPIVVDISTRRAGQLVLHSSDLPIRAPLAA